MDLRTRERRERLMITYGQIEATRAALNTAMHSSSATDDEFTADVVGRIFNLDEDLRKLARDIARQVEI